jgi:hypothetical protein
MPIAKMIATKRQSFETTSFVQDGSKIMAITIGSKVSLEEQKR